MAPAFENDVLMKVHNKLTNAWKLVKRDQTYTKQLTTIEETLARFGLLKNKIRGFVHPYRFVFLLCTVGYAVFAFFTSSTEEIDEHQVSDYEFSLVYNRLHAEAVNS